VDPARNDFATHFKLPREKKGMWGKAFSEMESGDISDGVRDLGTVNSVVMSAVE
jgi:hypothetical protein